MDLVLNAGIGGHHTSHLLERCERDVLVHRPTLVVLKVGANDGLNSNALVPVDEYRANLELLCERITAQAALLLLLLLLLTPLPFVAHLHATCHPLTAWAGEQPAARHAAIIAQLRAVAATRALPLFDLHAVIMGAGGAGDERECLLRNLANSGQPDGVHSNPAGYRMIGAAVYAAILAQRLPSAKTVCFGDSITFGSSVAGSGTVSCETYPAVLQRMLAAG